MANKAPSPFKEIDHLTEKHMQVILMHWLLNDRQHKVVAPNIQFVPGTRWECDLLSVSRSDYPIEYEIKIDRWDFLKDRKKPKYERYTWGEEARLPFKQFYYCVPDGMVSPDEVPEFAGLIYVSQHGNSKKPLNSVVKVMKKAPRRKVDKISHDELCQINRSLTWKLHNAGLSDLAQEVVND